MSGCPFHQAVTLPGDGTPLTPSQTIADWREAGPAAPLEYDDGHVGLVVTRYDAARAVLSDPRFSQLPHRMPRGPAAPVDHADRTDHAAAESPAPLLDDAARRSIDAANLLALDGDVHQRMRRGVTGRFSLKQVRGREAEVSQRVAAQLEHLRALGGPVDLFAEYAKPISAGTHCSVIGVHEELVPEFVTHFVAPSASSTQQRFDFIRRVVDRRAADPGEDVITDLLASEFSRVETEGLVFQLMSAGHDSVAYLIATATVALLTNPVQLERLREDPDRIAPAIEEFMRTGAMFLTLFPRTATEDVDLDGLVVPAGTTVSVSPVGANRDPRRYDDPETFDVDRDAFGHLGFGFGPHGCIGQQLARLEIRQAITQLLAGLPDLRLVEAEQLHPLPFANPVATYEAGAVIVTW
ncbi:Cytochrome P450 [Curtobacterium sp. 314Chir4.1]|uniref:cytochrome P450 n=1 Tax=Curtobacterium sp. 314Chir4.1 TaxID=1279028 RepID=UPI000BCB5E4C|nr:cytochrome P450 [Curtobacterium sp. 314Chir4.1]SOC87743.1 Cytochrome P450 [Curtobacterium sp. 314Chir4.1]